MNTILYNTKYHLPSVWLLDTDKISDEMKITFSCFNFSLLGADLCHSKLIPYYKCISFSLGLFLKKLFEALLRSK